MQSTNTFAQSCAPSKTNSLGPSQWLGHAWPMIISKDIFLIRRFFRNLGHLHFNFVTRFSKSNEGLSGLVACFFQPSLVLPVRISNVTWCWGWLLGLRRICPNSFTRFLFQDLFQNQAVGNAKHEHICSIMCSLQNEKPWTIALPWACRTHDNIKRYPFDPQIL